MGDYIDLLRLQPHPEGGAFGEVFRSGQTVEVSADGRERPAITQIYFHLRRGEVSRFHRVDSDEVWHLYDGEGVVLYEWQPGRGSVERTVVSKEEGRFCHVIPAGTWQAAEPLGEFVLVGCSVGPGFEFEDFTLIESGGPEALEILKMDASLKRFVSPDAIRGRILD